jgi:hypothetical protein
MFGLRSALLGGENSPAAFFLLERRVLLLFLAFCFSWSVAIAVGRGSDTSAETLVADRLVGLVTMPSTYGKAVASHTFAVPS